jgi:hypothetical protein
MTFNEWFYSKSYRNKYTPVDPAYLVAQEAWEAAHEACANLAKETVCDTHLPTGVKIYGTKAAAAIRARGQA